MLRGLPSKRGFFWAGVGRCWSAERGRAAAIPAGAEDKLMIVQSLQRQGLVLTLEPRVPSLTARCGLARFAASPSTWQNRGPKSTEGS